MNAPAAPSEPPHGPLPELAPELVHASTIAIDGRGVMLEGASGSGKSDLALRLIDRGAVLVSDDYTLVRRSGARLIASAPPNIAGRIEVRGLGVLRVANLPEVPVALVVALDAIVPRMADDPLPTRTIAGCACPMIALMPLEASAPIKVELALRRFGASGDDR